MLKDRFKFLRFKFSPSFTLMIVPHSKQSISRVHLSLRWVKLLLILITGIVFAVVCFGVNYLHMKKNMDELKVLRTVNKEQERKLKSLELETKDLQAKMLQLKHLERDVKDMLDEGEFTSRSGRSISRESSLSGRGGGSRYPVNDRDNTSLLSFFKHESVQEKTKEWSNRYFLTKNAVVSLAAQMDDIQQELNLLRKDVAARKAYLAARPLGLPAKGKISCGYGYRVSPFSGRKEFHPAVDIAAPYGAPVVATAKGRVVFAGYKAGYGRTVIIRHEYGFSTMYAHNSRINVHAGDVVSRGDCIARVGSSGTSTGPHVHYEVFVNGVRVNPNDYF